ncbi:MAG: SDR family NAD(P)-dependent oxidoreductase, partial [Stackebrandtia sp.]
MDDEWLRVFEETSRHTAEAHVAFLKMSETAIAGLAGVLGNGAAAAGQALTADENRPEAADAAGPAAWIDVSDGATPPASVPAVREQVEPPGMTVDAAPAQPETVAPLDSEELSRLLFESVAEVTGFPTEMLEADMELDTDLGIDSIKRVRIMSMMLDRVGYLPNMDVTEVAKLRTLGDIVSAMDGATSTLDRGAIEAMAGDTSLVAAISSVPYGTDLASVLSATDDVSGESVPQLRRLAVRAKPADAPGEPMPGLRDGWLAIVDDGVGVAAQVAEKLAAHEVVAGVVDEAPADAYGVVFLAGLRPASSETDMLAVGRQAFHTARVAASRMERVSGVFVTVQDTGGDFGLAGSEPQRAGLAGLAALARTAAREWPRASVKAIDCERGDRTPEEVAEVVVAELLEGGDQTDVGLRADGERTVLTDVETPVEPAAEPRIGPDSVIVATGGGRGVTAAALRTLASEYKPRLMLLGRTELEDEPSELREFVDEAALKRAVIAREQARGEGSPDLAAVGAEVRRLLAVREVRATLDDLRAAGSEATYLQADVCDPEALHTVLAEVRREQGPITGVVHGAGVLADSRLADKTDAQFQRVFDTKVEGLRNLLAETAEDPLRVLCVFSSVAARFGNAGQSDYAMANQVAAGLAAAERAKRPDCLIRAIAWGPWDGGMVDASMAEVFRDHG